MASAPDRVTLRFDESVEGNFQALRVFDSKGDRVDTGQVERPNGRGDELSVGLRSGLADGSYTATYRVISADSHPVSGGFVFSIGAPGAAPAQRVDQLIAASGTGRATDLAFGAVRFVNYAAIALALGGLAFLIAIWLPALARVAGAGSEWGAAAGAFERRARWLLVGAVVAGIVSGLLGIVLQGATAAGISVAAALDPGIVREVLGTRFGRVWMARVIAWVVLGGAIAVYASGGFRPALRPARLGATGLAGARAPAAWKVALLAVPAAFIAITPALGGHASTQSPSAALIPLDVAHVVAMSLWTGGLAMLLFVLPAATRRLEPPDRSRLLAAVLVRFSPLALACVILLLATGVAQSWIHIGAAGEVLGTAFGRAALIKFCLLLVLIGLGAVNRQRVVPRLRRVAAGGDPPGAAGRLLRRTLRAEVALIAVVLAVTAALVNFAPPGQAAVGPFSTNATIGPAHSRDDRRAGAGRRERDPPLPVQRGRRQPVPGHQAAPRAAEPARPRHRPDRGEAAEGRPGPLGDPRRDPRRARRLGGRDHQPRLRLRRVHDHDPRAHQAGGMIVGLLALAPALALICALLLGGYPGERALARIARARAGGGAPGSPARPRTPAAWSPPLPRGGRLIAAAMGRRGPPDDSRPESARRLGPAHVILEFGVLT